MPAAEYAQLDVDRLEVEKVRWSHAQLYDWYRYLMPEGLSGESIASAAIGENRIRIGVPNAAAEASVRSRLTALQIPCDLVILAREPYALP